MKTDRHKKILEVIDRYEVGTQEELAKILNDEGYNVTQATVSRDIRELNLSKVSVDGKRTRYATLTKDKPVAWIWHKIFLLLRLHLEWQWLYVQQ